MATRDFKYIVQPELKRWVLRTLNLGFYRVSISEDERGATVVHTNADPWTFRKIESRAKALKYGEEHQCFAMTDSESRDPEFRLSLVATLQGAGITSWAIIPD